jgi:hypothetical protein
MKIKFEISLEREDVEFKQFRKDAIKQGISILSSMLPLLFNSSSSPSQPPSSSFHVHPEGNGAPPSASRRPVSPFESQRYVYHDDACPCGSADNHEEWFKKMFC